MAGALENNGIGVPGTSPAVRIMPIVACDKAGRCFERFDQLALQLAATKHIDVVNLSQGSLPFTGDGDGEAFITRPVDCTAQEEDPGTYRALKAQEDRFYSSPDLAPLLIVRAVPDCLALINHAMRPKIHIYGVDVPNAPNVVAVTGMVQIINPLIDRSVQSGIAYVGGDVIDIAAPGQEISVLGHGADGRAASTAVSGTSFSTPFVSGTAALVLAIEPSLRGSPAAIKTRILENADKNATLPFRGRAGIQTVRDGNRLNACQAVANGPCPFPYGDPRLIVEPGPEAGVPENPCDGVVICLPPEFPVLVHFDTDGGVPIDGGTCICQAPVP